jgi:hypothetical protein
MKRVILGGLSVLSVFILPWWVVFLFAFALLFHFDRFYEIIIIALIADVIYGSIYFVGFPYFFTFISIIFLYTISSFKKNLIAY